jgi:hypothetical protein
MISRGGFTREVALYETLLEATVNAQTSFQSNLLPNLQETVTSPSSHQASNAAHYQFLLSIFSTMFAPGTGTSGLAQHFGKFAKNILALSLPNDKIHSRSALVNGW